MVLAKNHDVDRSKARKTLKDDLYKKLEAAKINHHMVLKDAKISTNFASITATVVREHLAQSALDIVFSALVRDIAVANRVHVLTHQMKAVDIHYIDHTTGDTIETVTKTL